MSDRARIDEAAARPPTRYVVRAPSGASRSTRQPSASAVASRTSASLTIAAPRAG